MQRRIALALVALATISVGFTTCATAEPPRDPNPHASTLAAIASRSDPVAFDADVRPILENRCVVCHACWDAPCQLRLSSPEGIERGASKQSVYDTSRLEAAPPTRLGVDATTTEAWRAKGFFAVLEPASSSLFLQMLALGRSKPFAAGERLPATVELDIGRKLTCPTAEEFDAYELAHPQGGMPYGTAPLADAELRTLATWAAQGAPMSVDAPVEPATAQRQVASWEAFLNGATTKERTVARYLYEHWFVAHLHFADLPAGPFYRVVRSRTPSGEPIDEIATRRPYDDPGAPFHYRLRRIDDAIVHKTHILYELSPARMARLRELFLANDWQAKSFPSWAPEVASNPFVAFAEIPPKSRYQYLLDDAHYFVDTFIRGPVCRGQVAVDVIEDQFWISFLDPDRDLSVNDPAFLGETAELLALPSQDAGWLEYNRKQRKYMNARAVFYEKADPKELGPALDWIWDGDGTNRNALLTVFRNFDNATVVKGFLGGLPKTAWVMDYPIFERIYYDLVAGYDVFGAAPHQISTRLYMDHLRMQAENLFLHFLPADRREAIRASWYVGATHQMDYFLANRLRGDEHGTQIAYHPGDPIAQFFAQLLARSAAIAGPPDRLNRCAKPPCDRADAGAVERRVERALQQIASVKGPWVAHMPEVSLLRVRVDSSESLLYALVHNVAHTNVAMMFGEDKRLVPADDTLSVVRGPFGSYPNFFFEIDAAEADAFTTELAAVASDSDFEAFVAQRGVRRTDPRFWATSDWLRADALQANRTEAGIYDLDRYGNP